MARNTPYRGALLRLIPAALLVGFVIVAAELQPLSAGVSEDVTSDAVQAVYRRDVPHTDWNGVLRTEYDADASLFPIGIYYTEPCRSSKSFSWARFTDSGHDNWDVFKGSGRKYDIVVNFGGTPTNDQLRTARYTVPEIGTGTQQATIDRLPAGGEPAFDYFYRIHPSPYQSFTFPAVNEDVTLAEGTFNLTCSPGDDDDPNVVQTLSAAGFNTLITGGYDAFSGIPIQHPEIYTQLKEQAGTEEFSLILNGHHGCFDFPDQLFSGQGYGQHGDILGWQLEDEPLHRAAWKNSACYGNDQGKECNFANMADALQRITGKYDTYAPQTGQAIYAVEATDYRDSDHDVFPCDPAPYWELFITAGDVANHDNYPAWFKAGVPFKTTSYIATSVGHQTDALDEAKPSWFTTQAFSKSGNGFPTGDRVRAAVYTAVIHGATGIFYFAWDNFSFRPSLVGVRPTVPLDYPEQATPASISSALASQAEQRWQDIASVNEELNELARPLLQRTSTVTYEVWVSRLGAFSESPVHSLLKSDDDAQYLLAVNMESSPVEVEFRFPSPPEAPTFGTVTTEFGGSSPSLDVANATIIDSLAAFAAKVYRIEYVQEDPENDDTDGDGCPDDQERGDDPVSGGLRDWFNSYDFYSVNGDGRVDLPNDILGVILRWTPQPSQPYDAAYDRGPMVANAPGSWSRAPADGVIDLPNDILGVILQWTHECSVA